MANRHLSRSIVLQALFEWDLNAVDKKDVIDILDRNIEEFAQNKTDRPFMEKLLTGILSKQTELDLVISKAAPEWPIDRISPVDRNILRLGLFELLFSERSEVPAKVAINEAIELAKQFGGDNSSRFVNGVLGAVYKEIGEPGKEEQSKRRKKEVPFDQMPIERLSGAVVYAEENGEMYFALVHDIFGHWTLSKSKVADAETVEQGAMRALLEEIGLPVEIEAELGNNEYIATQPEKGKVRKQVHYFLAKAPYQELVLAKKGGLDDARWFRVADILALNFYEDILPIVTKAITMLVGRRSK
ncbi:transcription antitermination factor NusB [Candidatus Kaiserbacteria bacterium RIFCSPLOWO2_02_FULL_45_11b]|uniref:Transcription antitermination protein NusB n=1 Tax=Candidatus Kaiserbacteria bacterium RIFCSPLOWO2_12_FULL_45_26 TaxID=1798525 RepID=A0A1F6FHG3_9BACT|nr:MAG: transcription antitermination factor NusB [Candidatus Kaiserbacteria bacterium RIFCSPHIGHO2_12_45_16]OGG70121.1 MAG: transcription antitermination factor NusB [Candidatus Kaiserbacteria bacterium RIFCSPLOWO2_01_FULL_45_25]OGG83795.1 MAG: transcription antitermination factor NusB [Candidatus Kaiserbacteria bacterium RIFCSPLOWO2_02_FULL_45_11b]OGG85291.1 MAG: transcription antitermination factor NusB [Candidatus Kaiserbacteria bacterium RIFCSPLOWO2_12_FULL_45_26]